MVEKAKKAFRNPNAVISMIAVLLVAVLCQSSGAESPALEYMAQEFTDLPFSQIVLVTTVCSLMMIPASLGYSFLRKKLGYRPIFIGASILLILGGVMPAFTPYGEGAFTNYCDMSHAYPDSVQHLPYKILLQHNPAQWREQILPETDIDLTLSGHTHAMQIILSFFGRRWSPASWRYSEWGGLYSNGNQHLYVNTGLGMVGVPMRIGATPEITIITLKKAS